MSSRRLPCRFVVPFVCAAFLGSGVAQDRAPLSAIDLSATISQDKLIAQLAAKRVVFVGETHDRYDHHLNQLEILRELYRLDPQLALGVEYLQQPFQAHVDDYISGRTTEQEFLRSSEYYQGWGFDYRLYAPIFRFARENHIPVRALNVPRDLAPLVAKVGLQGLSAEQRARLPKEIVPGDAAYRDRLREAFGEHLSTKPDAFDHFVEAQLVWDEGMAESAGAYLNANPGRRMVVLAGSGHVMFGDGIPQRLARRTGATYATVLEGDDGIEPRMADYILLSKEVKLAPAGAMGVTLEEKDGECRVASVSATGAAAKAGMKKGDLITQIDGQAIRTVADTKLAMWDKKPGDHAKVAVRRKTLLGGSNESSLDVELATAAIRTGR